MHVRFPLSLRPRSGSTRHPDTCRKWGGQRASMCNSDAAATLPTLTGGQSSSVLRRPLRGWRRCAIVALGGLRPSAGRCAAHSLGHGATISRSATANRCSHADRCLQRRATQQSLCGSVSLHATPQTIDENWQSRAQASGEASATCA